jgi:hypothetical protein
MKLLARCKGLELPHVVSWLMDMTLTQLYWLFTTVKILKTK